MNRSVSRLICFTGILSLALTALVFSVEDVFAKAPGKVQYIAHRGWSSKAPENTLPAFRLAAKNKGFYGVEFDIWESTAEKSVVSKKTIIDENGNKKVIESKAAPLLLVMHDDNIKRMCGVNKSIRKITRTNRTKYTIKSGSNSSNFSGLKIPTAEQSLDAIWNNSKGAIPVIELKHRLSKRALSYLFDLIGDHKVAIISFDYNAVTDAVRMASKRGISENVQTMYLAEKISSAKYTSTAKKLKKAGIDCISLKYKNTTRTAVKKFHKQGIRVCIWTVPNRKTAKKYISYGVDYITSNGAIF